MRGSLVSLLCAGWIACVAGCDSNSLPGGADLRGVPSDGGAGADLAAPADLAANDASAPNDLAAYCNAPGDCRLCSTMNCTCVALPASTPDSICSGGVACFADPCLNKQTACVNHACAVQ
jgi:hypothetical protein